MNDVSDNACVLVDLKHGLAIFFGTREEMQSRMESICDRCKSYGADVGSFLHILSQKEAGVIEYAYMVEKRRIPRRIAMRLQPKEVSE